MGKFDGILIATDLDGTLDISKENADAIRYFQDEGGIFTLATGRYPTYIKEMLSGFANLNTCLIALNGTIVYDMKSDRKIRVLKSDKKSIQKILTNSIGKYKDSICWINVCDEDESYKYEGEVYNDPCKCVFVMNDEKEAIALRDDLIKNYSNMYNVERSWPTGVEIYTKKTNKGEAVRYICQNINTDIKTVICIGNYENDVSMLKEADIGYAVLNATDDVKMVSDKITDVEFDKSAIAWIINKLGEEGTGK